MTVILACDNSPCRFNKQAQCQHPTTVIIDASGSCASAEYDDDAAGDARTQTDSQDPPGTNRLHDTDWFKSI